MHSPFQESGALLSGSPLFVGREEELAYIQERLRTASILMTGGRGIGKSSLLHKVGSWAGEQPDLAPAAVDLLGCKGRANFMARLRMALKSSPLANLGSLDDLDDFAASIRQSGRLPVFLLDEVDGLVRHDSPFVSTWQNLSKQGLAHFMMTGHGVVGDLEAPTSPLFDFPTGPHFGGRALALNVLSETAAEQLLAVLEEDLGIGWESDQDRRESYRLCLDQSYRIPWVLQRYAHRLVGHLNKVRRWSLAYQDVESIVRREKRTVWQYLTDFTGLGFGGADTALLQLALTALARRRYFLADEPAPVLAEPLPQRPSLDPALAFTAEEVVGLVLETLEGPLMKRERDKVERGLDALDLHKAFRLFTLTLILESDPTQDGRYGFLLHMLPRELLRLYGPSASALDGRIHQLAGDFLRLKR